MRNIKQTHDPNRVPLEKRWTNHLVISAMEELDGELFQWIRQAYEFAEMK